jgi:hypothetical protein
MGKSPFFGTCLGKWSRSSVVNLDRLSLCMTKKKKKKEFGESPAYAGKWWLV